MKDLIKKVKENKVYLIIAGIVGFIWIFKNVFFDFLKQGGLDAFLKAKDKSNDLDKKIAVNNEKIGSLEEKNKDIEKEIDKENGDENWHTKR